MSEERKVTWREVRWKHWLCYGEDGRVLGGVQRGGFYDQWEAHARVPERRALGEYATEAQAKAAVQRALSAPAPVVPREGVAELVARITDYLSSGGLFNPEMATHDRVRDLLIDCRAALSQAGEPGREERCVCGCPAATHSCNGGVGDAECGCESFVSASSGATREGATEHLRASLLNLIVAAEKIPARCTTPALEAACLDAHRALNPTGL